MDGEWIGDENWAMFCATELHKRPFQCHIPHICEMKNTMDGEWAMFYATELHKRPRHKPKIFS